MKKFDAKGQIILRPKRFIAPETDFAVFIVIEIFRAEDFGQVGARGMEWSFRAFEGALGYVGQIHIGGFRTSVNSLS